LPTEWSVHEFVQSEKVQSQFGDTADKGRATPRHSTVDELGLRRFVDQRIQDGLDLQPGQPRTEASVRTVTERDVVPDI
jgi:hypothetical protein